MTATNASGSENEKGEDEIKAKPSKRASVEKWGAGVVDIGFVIVPSLLLRAQQRLRINPTQLAVLIHLMDYWWDVARKPYPSKKTLSQRMGISARQVQRHIASLESSKLLKRVERHHPARGKQSNEYDLSGLVRRLAELEPEFRAVEEQVKAERRKVARPALRPKTQAK